MFVKFFAVHHVYITVFIAIVDHVKVLEVYGYVSKLLDKLFVSYVSVAVLGCKELCMYSVIN